MQHETVWTFETARYVVALEIMPEEMDPADSFEHADDIAAVRNGLVEWFCARVSVYFKPDQGAKIRLGSETLGGCAYNTVREFYTSHRDRDPMNRNCTIMRLARGGRLDAAISICHYFPAMVSEAIADARRNMDKLCSCN